MSKKKKPENEEPESGLGPPNLESDDPRLVKAIEGELNRNPSFMAGRSQ
jgi:hypothetical protein